MCVGVWGMCMFCIIGQNAERTCIVNFLLMLLCFGRLLDKRTDTGEGEGGAAEKGMRCWGHQGVRLLAQTE